MNEYRGFQLTSSSWEIPRVSASQLNTPAFWAYIAKRCPVVITDAQSTLCDGNWSIPELEKHAGDDSVVVEVRAKSGRAYGKGVKSRMKYHEFLHELPQGNHYLTTQPISDTEYGPEALMTVPTCHLTDLWSKAAHSLSPLIPSSWNIWHGSSTHTTSDQTSSGLHHDFHDNLYVLIRGSKIFELASPDQLPHINTAGTITHIHWNGLVNYEATTRSDGAPATAVAQWQLEQVLARAAAGQATPAEVKAARAVLRSVQSTGVLHAATGLKRARVDPEESAQPRNGDTTDDAGDDSEIEWGSVAPDSDDSDDAALEAALEARMAAGDDAWSDEDDDDDFGEVEEAEEAHASHAGAGSAAPSKAAPTPATAQWAALEAAAHPRSAAAAAAAAAVDTAGNSTVGWGAHEVPPSFSTLPVNTTVASAGCAELASVPFITVALGPGDGLYIPAGWIHNVTSAAASGEDDHLAFNVWAHPPSSADRARPYDDKYWQSWYDKVAPAEAWAKLAAPK